MIKFIDISLLIISIFCSVFGAYIIASRGDHWYLGIILIIISILFMRISVRSLRGNKKIG